MTQLLNISAEDAEEYSQSLAQIGEGWWRQLAWAFRQGIPEALGMSRREWAVKYHGYFKLEIPERREAVAELSNEGMNNSQIADTLGVGEATVRRDLNGDSPSDESLQESAMETQVDGSPAADESPDDELADELLWTESTEQPAEGQAVEPDPEPVTQLNDGDEWYTPRWLFDALGIRFSIDVCAPPDLTYTSVPADKYFTVEDDGLAQRWTGTIWCNPPYSRPEPWARRLIHHGDGLLLTHIPMNAVWCVDVWEACDAIRLFQAMEFVRPDGTSRRPGYWLQLAAFGPNATEALARLEPLGQAAFNKRRVASPMWRRAS